MSGTTESHQSGFVPLPLPAEVLGDGSTLEMTRLHLASGDRIGPYDHRGAAVYFVDAGTIVVTAPAGSGTVRRFTAGDDIPEMPASCASGCEMNAGDWLSFDASLNITIAVSGGDADVLIASLTPAGGYVEIRSALGEDVIVIEDSGFAGPLDE